MAIKDTVAIYSGGMDSFTLVNELLLDERLHSCLSFDYGQRHKKELDYACAWARRHSVPHTVVNLTSAAFHCMTGSALTRGRDVPEGHYAAENMKQTVVPNRNAVMLSLAIAYAVAHGLDRVSFGAHAGDHEIYPDCRPEFVDLMNKVGLTANWHPVRVEAPYLTYTKYHILSIGFVMNLDYSESWTCYKGHSIACGKCGSCQERLAAFDRHGMMDPLDYESRELIPAATEG